MIASISHPGKTGLGHALLLQVPRNRLAYACAIFTVPRTLPSLMATSVTTFVMFWISYRGIAGSS